jgi:hypothetical protein
MAVSNQIRCKNKQCRHYNKYTVCFVSSFTPFRLLLPTEMITLMFSARILLSECVWPLFVFAPYLVRHCHYLRKPVFSAYVIFMCSPSTKNVVYIYIYMVKSGYV